MGCLDFCLFVSSGADSKSTLVWLENHAAQEDWAVGWDQSFVYLNTNPESSMPSL